MDNLEITTHNLQFHDNASIYAICYKNKKLITGGGDTDIRIWEVTAGEHTNGIKNALTTPIRIEYVTTITEHPKIVNCVRISNCGMLASCSDGGTVIVSFLKENECKSKTIRKMDGHDAYDLQWHSNLLSVVLSNGHIAIFKFKEGTVIKFTETKIHCDNIQGITILSSLIDKSIFVATQCFDRNVKLNLIKNVYDEEEIAEENFCNFFDEINENESKIKNDENLKDEEVEVIKLNVRKKSNLLQKNEIFKTCKRIDLKIETIFRINGQINETQIVESQSFFRRLNFVEPFLFLSSTMSESKFSLSVLSHPYNRIYLNVFGFDSLVLKTIKCRDFLVAATKKSIYFLKDFKCEFCVFDLCFKPITDLIYADGIVFVSSLDGFIYTIRHKNFI